MPELSTWAAKSKFSYEGSVKEGTRIIYDSGYSIYLSAEQYANLLHTFGGRTVNMAPER